MTTEEIEKGNEKLREEILSEIEAKFKELGVDCDSIDISIQPDFSNGKFGWNITATPIKNNKGENHDN